MIRMKKNALVGLVGLLGLLFAVSAPMSAGVGPGPGPSSGGVSPGSDDVTSAPLVVGPSAPGFVFEVPAGELRGLLSGIRGQGSIDIKPTAEGTFQVTLTGVYSVKMRGSALSRGNVQLGYRGQRGTASMRKHRGEFVLTQR